MANGKLRISNGKLKNIFFYDCTVCNRTFYGDLGKTYELKLNKPDEKKLPFLCHFTFTANGHIHGDIVQVCTTHELGSSVNNNLSPILFLVIKMKRKKSNLSI